MRIGYMFESNENRNLTGINGVINGIAREVSRIDGCNEYYAVEENYLKLPLGEMLYPQLARRDASQRVTELLCYCQDVELIHSYFHAFDFLKYPCKKVLTIHDLIPIVRPEFHTQRDYFEGPLRRAANMADKIIAVSYNTKRDIIECYGIAEEKIQVIYNGFNTELEAMADKSGIIRKYGLEEGYILSVCTLEPRKNLRGLLEAFDIFKSCHPNSKLKLVLTGKAGWDAEVRALLKGEVQRRDDIVLTGYVDNQVLAALYSGALAVAYVSFYEGFGLPILEAMKYGKAVLTANNSSMPEVGGDAAIYCDPYDKESILDSIEKLIFDETLRRSCEEKAIVQADKFSYEKAARETIALYQTLGVD